MALLIDSTVLIGLERRGKPPADAVTIGPDEELAMAAITASEILVGVHNADSPQRRKARGRWVEEALARFTVLPFNLEAARQYAEVWADLADTGNMIGFHEHASGCNGSG